MRLPEPHQATRAVALAVCCAALACVDTLRPSAPAEVAEEQPASSSPSTAPELSAAAGTITPSGAQLPLGITHADRDAGSQFPLRPSPIAQENARPGNPDFQLRNYNRDLAGYTDRTSYAPGDTVQVHLAFSQQTTATWTLYRLGYYGGKLGRKVMTGGPVAVSSAPATSIDSTTGAVRANFPVAFTFTVPIDAVTGVHLIKFDTPAGDARALFVVREKVPAAVALMPLPVNTYQAYNLWGGTSLYGNTRSDWSYPHAFAVSFERPYLRGNGLGEFEIQDRAFIAFAESQGYDLAYATDVDLDQDPTLLERRRLVVIEGHSEYWTRGMRDAVETAIASGTHAIFLGANNAYWQVRYEQRASGELVLVGYKDYAAAKDPVASTSPALVTDQWRRPAINRPENAMIGSMFGTWMWTAAPLTVKDSSSWIWTGSGVTQGTTFAGIYEDESDRRVNNGAAPPGVQLMADGWVEGYGGEHARAETTIYTAASGATVFNAGSIGFSQALHGGSSADPRIQQLVANLFSRFAGEGRLGPAAFTAPPPVTNTPAYDWVSGAVVSTVATGLDAPAAIGFLPDGGAVVAEGNQLVVVREDGSKSLFAGGVNEAADDGPAATARFSKPRGLAVAANGDVFVADTGNNRIRKISNGMVTTLAGSIEGFADGAGATARFRRPMAVALRPSGALLVADTFNHRIREVGQNGSTATIAGSGELGLSNGSGAQAALSFPFSISLLAGGQAAVIAEPATGVVRKVDLKGGFDVSVLAGVANRSGWEDGPRSSARASETWAVLGAPSGNVILLDSASARVRRIRGDRIETIAGGARGDHFNGAGSEAGFGAPRAAAFAPDGSLWIADPAHGAIRRIRLESL